MWFRRDPAAEKLKQLKELLPDPAKHMVRSHRSEKMYQSSHRCEIDGDYTPWCRAVEQYQYLEESALADIEGLWKAINTFQTAKQKLGEPSEMQEQWLLLLEQALAVAEAIQVEKPAAEKALGQAIDDAKLVGENQSQQVREADDAVMAIRAGIREGYKAIRYAAGLASDALAAKEAAEELTAAIQRRALNGAPSSEAALRASRLAAVLAGKVSSLEKFTDEVRASTGNLKELTS